LPQRCVFELGVALALTDASASLGDGYGADDDQIDSGQLVKIDVLGQFRRAADARRPPQLTRRELRRIEQQKSFAEARGRREQDLAPLQYQPTNRQLRRIRVDFDGLRVSKLG